jgi:hypothetical protein
MSARLQHLNARSLPKSSRRLYISTVNARLHVACGKPRNAGSDSLSQPSDTAFPKGRGDRPGFGVRIQRRGSEPKQLITNILVSISMQAFLRLLQLRRLVVANIEYLPS